MSEPPSPEEFFRLPRLRQAIMIVEHRHNGGPLPPLVLAGRISALRIFQLSEAEVDTLFLETFYPAVLERMRARLKQSNI